MPDGQTHAIHYGALEVLFCNHPVLASFVSRFGDGYFIRRHTSIKFYVCGHRIAVGDLLALVIDTDIQSVCIPLSCVKDKAEEALGARDRAPCRRRNIFDVQLLEDEVDLWVNVEGLLDS